MSDFMQWATHGVKRGRFEMGPRMALYLFVLAVSLTLVAALYLTLVSRTAAQGRHIQQLQVELSRLQRGNEQLEVDVAREGSISRLRERVVELGLAPAERVEFLPLADTR